MVEHVLEEERSGHPLADRPALEVGEGHHDGVDVPRADLVRQRLEREHACTLSHGSAAVHHPTGSGPVDHRLDYWLDLRLDRRVST